jgi:adenylate cyclase
MLYSFTTIAQLYSIDSLKKVLQTQKEDTNKVKTLYTLSWRLSMTGNLNPAINLAQTALALAEKINFKKGKAYAFKSLGIIYYNNQNIDLALKNYLIALKLYAEINDKRSMATIYAVIGDISTNKVNLPEAIADY